MSAAAPVRISTAGLFRQLFAGLPGHARGTFAIRIAAVGLEFLSLLVLARLLDAEDYGSYALAMTLVAIFAVPAAVGFDRLVVRELAAFQALGDWQHAHGLLRRSFFIVLGASAAAAIATWLAGRLILKPLGADAVAALVAAAALVPLLAFARLRQAALQGLGHVNAGLAPEFLLQPAIVILLAAIAALWPAIPRGATLAVGFQVAAAATSLLVGAWFLRRRLPPALRGAAPRYRDRAWWSASLAFMGLVMMTTVLTNVDTILVGRLVGNAEAELVVAAAEAGGVVMRWDARCAQAANGSSMSLTSRPMLEAMRIPSRTSSWSRRISVSRITFPIHARSLGRQRACSTKIGSSRLAALTRLSFCFFDAPSRRTRS